MPCDYLSDIFSTERAIRMYGSDFYELTPAQKRIRVQSLDRQYRRETRFIDDMRLEDWRRGVMNVMWPNG